MAVKQDVLVALGANIPLNGELPKVTLSLAVDQLQAAGLELQVCSPFYNTPCFPAGAGPDYVNAAARFRTEHDVETVLQILHEVEGRFGRERITRWAGRTLDLDLLAAGDMVLPDAETVQSWIDLPLDQQMQKAPDKLILPHPRLQERAFVLIPLCDVAPDWYHPILGSTVAELCAKLPIAARQEVVLA
ncbi:MAG: 2-amino-4-hydroxy-6-hydroxymethyldihydropteridine diphosphokinase [Thalassovita sp.]